jgi:glucose/mannose-6-phosphate isomerase
VTVDLDDVQALRAHDPSGMLDVVSAMPSQCRAAYDDAVSMDAPSADGVGAVTFCGMGGSAVAGDVLRSVFRDRLRIPVDVNRTPILPEYCGPHTLVVASSYSGNTGETLAAFHEAVRRGCRVAAVTAGGELGARAGSAGAPVATVPAGFMPRAALGYLTFGLLGLLQAMGLLPPLRADVDETVGELEALVERLGPAAAVDRNPAKALAGLIRDRVPVVWGAEGIGAVAAARWKAQLNENGKVPAFASSMSELDHNEVVGWTRPFGAWFSLVALRHDGEPDGFSERFERSYEIARDAGVEVEEVHAAGRSPLARLFSLILAGDFTSVYVALRREVDPTPVAAIDRIKAALGAGGRS